MFTDRVTIMLSCSAYLKTWGSGHSITAHKVKLYCIGTFLNSNDSEGSSGEHRMFGQMWVNAMFLILRSRQDNFTEI